VLTIVTYHYVRDLAMSRYPDIRAITTADFDRQLDYIAKHYTVVSLEDVETAAVRETPLPLDACLLTFDDGLIDHFVTVFPRLASRGWPAAFFPVDAACEGRRVLDVHKIQFVLAVTSDPNALARRVLTYVAEARRDHDLPSDDELWTQFAKPNRFDPPALRFVKNVLQHGLPQPLRGEIVHRLFEDLVGVQEHVLAHELYMDLEQMRCMAGMGMAFGGHGSHAWLGRSTPADQMADFQRSRALLERIYRRPVEGWTMCYPHGSYDAMTFEVARETSCVLGLTVQPGVVRDFLHPLELPRVDTTDIPVFATRQVRKRVRSSAMKRFPAT
jgi:peptidoglycan/xylan/chitin deacetylase (PgdA/CDA1 family)